MKESHRRSLRPGGGDEGEEIREEIEHYLEERARELEAGGMPPAEARAEARRLFGDPEGVASHVHRIRRAGRRTRGLRDLLDDLTLDLRLTLRGLRRSPGFTAVVVGTVALAMATNAAVFALVDAYFLKPLPYEDPGELVVLWETRRDSRETNTVAPGTYRDWREQARTLQAVGASNITWPTLSGEGAPPERLMGTVATPELMNLLGVEPALGRGFRPEDGREGAEPVVLLSHGLWTRRYGADPGIVGRTVRVSGTPTTVIGVMPPAFRHPGTFRESRNAELWLPMGDQGDGREFNYLHVVGRLAPGAELSAARAELASLMDRAAVEHPETHRGVGVVVRPLDQELFGDLRRGLLLLLGAAALVLLIACANLANLMLARGSRRARELAVRAALGSGRRRLLRLLTVEAMTLGLAGGIVGAAVVVGLSGPLSRAGGRYLSAMGDVSVNPRVLAFTLLGALFTAVLFGVLPALRMSRPGLGSLLGDRSGGSASPRARRLLVVGEVALTVVLLITGGLLVRSLVSLVTVPTGFQVENALVFETYPPPDRYPEVGDVRRFYEELSTALTAIPGITAVTTMSDLPFTTENRSTGFRVMDRPLPRDEERSTEYHIVGPEYFEVMGIPVLEGRTFGPGDRPETPLAAVVSRELARRVWPEGSPVGTTLHFQNGDTRWTAEVVGMVGDALDDGLDASPEPRLYYSASQAGHRGMGVIVRTTVPPASVAGALRTTAAALDDQVAVADLRTLEEHVLLTTARPRGAALLVGAFAALALLLAAVGIFGVLAYSVAERRRELGIRAALGAAREKLVAMVLKESLRLTAAGALAGGVLAVLAGRLLGGMLFEVRPFDPVVSLVALAAVVGVATAAAWIPAVRASRVAPSEAMREG